jgi:hypothetical protein
MMNEECFERYEGSTQSERSTYNFESQAGLKKFYSMKDMLDMTNSVI